MTNFSVIPSDCLAVIFMPLIMSILMSYYSCTHLDTDEKVHCAVKLRSMFQPEPEQQGQRDLHHFAADRTNAANDQQATTTEMSTPEKQESPPNLLWIRGVINHACICPTWLHPTKGYSCIGMDDRHVDDSTNSALCSQRYISGWFQELLLYLANDSKLLVCKVGSLYYSLGTFILLQNDDKQSCMISFFSVIDR